MKNKKIIIAIISLITVLLVSAMIYILSIQRKGFSTFGNEHCTCRTNITAGPAFTSWTCKLCGISGTKSTTSVPEICNICSILTGRCPDCGNLKK